MDAPCLRSTLRLGSTPRLELDAARPPFVDINSHLPLFGLFLLLSLHPRVQYPRQSEDAELEHDQTAVADRSQDVEGWLEDEGEAGDEAAEEVDEEEDKADAEDGLKRELSSFVVARARKTGKRRTLYL